MNCRRTSTHDARASRPLTGNAVDGISNMVHRDSSSKKIADWHAGERGRMPFSDAIAQASAQIILRSYRKVGVTLIEILVVVGIIGIAMGMGIAGIMPLMSRSDMNATVNIISGVHRESFQMARTIGGAAIIYGFTIEYKNGTAYGKIPNTAYVAATIAPWYVRYGQAQQPFASDYALQSAFGSGLIATGTSFTFSDKQMPCGKVTLSAFTNGVAVPTTTTISSSKFLHVAYEPGTGFMHAYLGASSDYTLLDSPSELVALAPNQVEITLYSIATNAAQNRVILYMNGNYETKGPK